MKKSDLFRKWAWVLDMCEGTGVNPRECVKIGGVVNMEADPVFDLPAGCYTFMVALLEGKPLFVGNEVYWKSSGDKFDWDKGELCHADYYQNLTRTPPERTITLNGEKLPAPNGDEDNFCSLLIIGLEDKLYFYKNHDDLEKVEKAINKLLSGE